MTFQIDQPLALNAIGSVVIHGLVKTRDGEEVDVQAVRSKPPPLVAVHEAHLWVRPDGFPPRVPDNLPEPRDFRLELSIGENISTGGCGRVLGTSTVSLSDPSNLSDILSSPGPPVLPELVVKVARPRYRGRLRREAAAYHEIQAIQGVSVARCYGWFEADLERDHVLFDDGYESDDWDSDSSSNAHAANRSKDSPMNKVSFIVLERLGHNLEMNVDYEPDADIYQVYEDLGHMGVDHADVRYANILRLSKSPLALAGQKCPFHNCVHLYRVVDFDRATKTDFTVKGYNARTEVDLGMLCKGTKGMARGTIVGP